MVERTLRARVVMVGSGSTDVDLGEKDITLRDIIEQGHSVGSYATLAHNGQTVVGTVAEISPFDWEQSGRTPTVRVNRSRAA
jgi:hypothetical protein